MSNNPVFLAFLATMGTWAMTALGAALVFFFKTIKAHVMNSMLGFASGVMIAASFWSLLAPAIEIAEGGKVPAYLVASIGFLLGGGFLWLSDHLLPHAHIGSKQGDEEGLPTHLRRSILLVLSITLHNFPEGLAVGVAIGSAAIIGGDSMMGALVVAIGIGLQNLPEGAAVSIPLRRENLSRRKAFFYGQASGIVEPLGGVLGALLVTQMQPILPYALSFAAGAMIYVVVEELIPESQAEKGDHKGIHYATFGTMLGFVTMMVLDVALG
ncbi:MAG: ZIP family metal transporter [Sphaerochaeta sp.]|jgi:ZIP family zinc transporter|uniref:ZIP family metal transporter n=1 Tax=Sphaerochaeta sp. TaxID=1972642 RepID=UPI001D557989|nr:ZIP family metal transporter [uncultured Sphaerochaeta sp.]MDD3930249.1 ZIP family metal transporter [Sphaerochaeta sp.]NCC11998.1 ZIP family metal transporter [Spirochaetia bacterium]NCC89371.1 ZIP family metal transporter [Spirochaetia bacterium]